MGYTKDDIYNLQSQFKSQALNRYLSGNYILKNLDNYGQRVAIKITLNNHSFYSGWMLEPEGTIRNTTPFGGWVNEKYDIVKLKDNYENFNNLEVNNIGIVLKSNNNNKSTILFLNPKITGDYLVLDVDNSF